MSDIVVGINPTPVQKMGGGHLIPRHFIPALEKKLLGKGSGSVSLHRGSNVGGSNVVHQNMFVLGAVIPQKKPGLKMNYR